MKTPSEYLPENLKRLRGSKNWSLSTAAAHTGVSKAMLGQIERGESSPTLAILWKIATGLEISFSELVSRGPTGIEFEEPVLIDSERQRKEIADDGMLVAIIQDYDERLGFEWFEITFPAGYERSSDPHKSGAIEIISVISGQLTLTLNGITYDLQQGQSIKFNGEWQHMYQNKSENKAVIHCVMHYQKGTV